MAKTKAIRLKHLRLLHLNVRHLTLEPSEEVADYVLTKTASKYSGYVGDTITYYFVFKNNTDFAVTNVVITDPVSAAATLVVGSVVIGLGTGVVDIGNGGGDTSVQVTFPSVAAKEMVQFQFNATLDSEGGTVNQGSVVSDQFPAFNSNQTIVTVTQPVLSLVQASDKSIIYNNSSEEATVTVTLDNTGSGSAENVVLTDPVDANLTLVPGSVVLSGYPVGGSLDVSVPIVWSFSSLPAGENVTLTYRVTTNNLTSVSLQSNITVDNHANISSNTVAINKSLVPDFTQVSDKDILTNLEKATITITIDPSVSTKSAANAFYRADFNQRLRYVSGSFSLVSGSGVVTVEDPYLRIDFGTINLVQEFTFEVEAFDSEGLGTLVGESAGENYSVLVQKDITVNFPVLVISNLTIEGSPTAVVAGDIIKFLATVNNTGSGKALAVYLTDSLTDTNLALVVGSVVTPQGSVIEGNTGGDTTVEVDIGDLIPDSIVIEYQVTVNPGMTPLPGNVASRFTLDGDNFADYTTPDRSVIVVAPPVLAGVLSTPVTTQIVGYDIDVTIVINNTGGEGFDVFYSDTVPQQSVSLVVGTVTCVPKGTVIDGNTGGDTEVLIDIGEINDQEIITIGYTLHIESDYLPAGPATFDIQGLITGSNFNDVPTNIVQITVEEAAVYTFTLASLNGLTHIAGDTIQIENTLIVAAGTSDLHDVDIATIIPTGFSLVVGSVITSQGSVIEGNQAGDIDPVVDVGSVVKDTTVTINYNLLVVAPPPTIPASIPLIADLIASNDPGGASNTVNFSIVIPTPSISGVKSSDKGSYIEGETIDYTIIVTAGGTADSQGVVLTDLIDAAGGNLVVGSVVITGQGVVVEGNTGGDTKVVVNIGLLSIGSSTQIDYQVLLDDPYGPGVPNNHVNKGTLTGNNFDPVDTNTLSVGVTSPIAPNITAVKSFEDPGEILEPGLVVDYQLVVSNIGNAEATNVIVTDLLADTNLTLVVGSVTTSRGTILEGNTGGDTYIQIDLGTFEDSGVATITYDATINPGIVLPETVSNFATVESNELPDVNSNILEKDVYAPDMVVDKVGDISTINTGETVTFTVTITNNGGADALNVYLIDLISDSRYSLVVGSVVAPEGTIVEGNTGGDTTVEVDFGTVNKSGGEVTATYDCIAVVGSSSGAISNTASVTGDNFTTVNKVNNATITAPLLSFVKSATESGVDAGDPINYQLSLENIGDGQLNNLEVLEGFSDSNLSLVVGSVSVNLGATITKGNTGGDTTIEVALAALLVSNTLVVNFQGLTNGGMGAGNVVNQSSADGDNLNQVLSNQLSIPVTGTSGWEDISSWWTNLDFDLDVLANPGDEVIATDWVSTNSVKHAWYPDDGIPALSGNNVYKLQGTNDSTHNAPGRSYDAETIFRITVYLRPDNIADQAPQTIGIVRELVENLTTGVLFSSTPVSGYRRSKIIVSEKTALVSGALKILLKGYFYGGLVYYDSIKVERYVGWNPAKYIGRNSLGVPLYGIVLASWVDYLYNAASAGQTQQHLSAGDNVWGWSIYHLVYPGTGSLLFERTSVPQQPILTADGAIRFDGIDDYLAGTNTNLTSSTQYTVILRVKPLSDGTTKARTFIAKQYNSFYSLHIGTNNALIVADGISDINVVPNYGQNYIGVDHTIIWYQHSTGAFIRLVGGPLEGTYPFTQAGLQPMRLAYIGTDANSGRRYHGDIWGIVIYEGPNRPTDDDATITYLNTIGLREE